MRSLVALLSLTLLLAATARADDTYIVTGPSVDIATVPNVPGELDTLFKALKAAENPVDGKRVEDAIWKVWMRAPDLPASSRLNRALKYRGYGEYWDALDQAEKLVAAHPDYAEGYNQRAFLKFLMDDPNGSLADCRKALELEPRHFGCMAGMARIHRDAGRTAEARKLLERAIALHPFIAERRLMKDLAPSIQDL